MRGGESWFQDGTNQKRGGGGLGGFKPTQKKYQETPNLEKSCHGLEKKGYSQAAAQTGRDEQTANGLLFHSGDGQNEKKNVNRLSKSPNKDTK